MDMIYLTQIMSDELTNTEITGLRNGYFGRGGSQVQCRFSENDDTLYICETGAPRTLGYNETVALQKNWLKKINKNSLSIIPL